MKRLTHIFILLFLTSDLISQDIVTIEGITYAVPSFRLKDTIPLENVEVRLRLKDTTLMQLTLADGKFLFKLNRSAQTATLDVLANSQTTKSREKYLCFFWGGGVTVVDLNKASTTKKIELRANELMHCAPGIPEIFFSKNSTTPNGAISYDTIPIDIAINNLLTLLTDFPKMQLEIDGHSDSKETDKINLAAKRSKFIADKLISLGAKKSQVVVKSYSDKRPFPNVPSTKDKSILAQRNQRVAFKILTFGFEDNGPDNEEH